MDWKTQNIPKMVLQDSYLKHKKDWVNQLQKNADNIKVLDNEINCILEEKKNKEINRK